MTKRRNGAQHWPVTDNMRRREIWWEVLLSAYEFTRPKRLDREVLRVDDFPEADLETIRSAEPPAEAAAFDDEVTG